MMGIMPPRQSGPRAVVSLRTGDAGRLPNGFYNERVLELRVLELDASGTGHYTSAVQLSFVSMLRAGKRGSVIFRGMPCRGGVN